MAQSIFIENGLNFVSQFDRRSQKYFNNEGYLDLKVRNLERFELSEVYSDKPHKMSKIHYLIKLMNGLFESIEIVFGEETENLKNLISIRTICSHFEKRKEIMKDKPDEFMEFFSYIETPIIVEQEIDSGDASMLYPTEDIEDHYKRVTDSLIPKSFGKSPGARSRSSSSRPRLPEPRFQIGDRVTIITESGFTQTYSDYTKSNRVSKLSLDSAYNGAIANVTGRNEAGVNLYFIQMDTDGGYLVDVPEYLIRPITSSPRRKKVSASTSSSETSFSDTFDRSRRRDRSRGSDRSRMLRTPSPDERFSSSRSDSASSNPFQGTTLDSFGLRGKQ